MEYKITASIVLYNTNKDFLYSIFDCIQNSIIDKVYVIDNSPKDNLRELVLSISTKVEYIFGHGNIGYGAGHNIALNKAINLDSLYHVVLNPDIQFDYDVISHLEYFLNQHQDIGLILPNVVYPNGELQYLCKLLPTPLDMFGRRLLPKKLIEKRNFKYEMRETGYNEVRNVPCLSGCFMFMRTNVLKQIGLFDDRFFMYFEDFDLIRRIHKVAKTVFYPKLTIVHNHAREHKSSKKLLKISIFSTIKYFNKWGWFFDKDRRRWNREAFNNSNIIS